MIIKEQIKGEFEIIVHNNGKLRLAIPAQSNRFLNRYFDRWLDYSVPINSAGLLTYCRFGSDTSPVLGTDTTIVQVGSASTSRIVDDTITKISNTQFRHRAVFTFATSAVVGTVNCIALSDSSGPSTPVNVKALLAAPVTFIAGDLITVNYFTTTIIPDPAVDITGTLSLSSGVHNYTLRRLAYDPTLQLSSPSYYKPYFPFASPHWGATHRFGLVKVNCYSTQILSDFAGNGTQLNPTAGDTLNQDLVKTRDFYTAGNLYLDMEVKLDINTGNGVSGGIGSIAMYNNVAGESPSTGLQIAFSPKIPKTNLDEFKLNLRFAFGP